MTILARIRRIRYLTRSLEKGFRCGKSLFFSFLSDVLDRLRKCLTIKPKKEERARASVRRLTVRIATALLSRARLLASTTRTAFWQTATSLANSTTSELRSQRLSFFNRIRFCLVPNSSAFSKSLHSKRFSWNIRCSRRTGLRGVRAFLRASLFEELVGSRNRLVRNRLNWVFDICTLRSNILAARSV
jgi:hypothetical protein